MDQCFIAPLPPKHSTTELILFMPLDKSCWIFLGVTVGISAIIWRFFEGSNSHWKFLFGMFALFVGQYSDIKA
jgi:hypothetical protein